MSVPPGVDSSASWSPLESPKEIIDSDSDSEQAPAGVVLPEPTAAAFKNDLNTWFYTMYNHSCAKWSTSTDATFTYIAKDMRTST